MSEHSRGPWQWEDDGFLVDSAGYIVLRTDEDYGTTHADDRLIAAAPKLLAALKRIGAIEPGALDEDARYLIRSIEEG